MNKDRGSSRAGAWPYGRTIRVPLRDADGVKYWWEVRRHQPTGIWEFTDHTGYIRHGGENHRELVARFASVADNHGFTHNYS